MSSLAIDPRSVVLVEASNLNVTGEGGDDEGPVVAAADFGDRGRSEIVSRGA